MGIAIVVNISKTCDRYIAIRFDGLDGQILIRFRIAFLCAALDVNAAFALAHITIRNFPDGEFAFGGIRLHTDRQFFFDGEIETAIVVFLDGYRRYIRFGHGFQICKAIACISEILGIDGRHRVAIKPRIVFHIDGDVVSFDIRCFRGCGWKRIRAGIDDAVFDGIQQRFFVPLGIVFDLVFLIRHLGIVSSDGCFFLLDHRVVITAKETHILPFFEKFTFIRCLELAVWEGIDDAAVSDIQRHIAAIGVDLPDAHISRRLGEGDIFGRLRIDAGRERIAIDRHLARIHIGCDAAIGTGQIDAFGGNPRTISGGDISFLPLRHELECIRFGAIDICVSSAGQIHIALSAGYSRDGQGNILASCGCRIHCRQID